MRGWDDLIWMKNEVSFLSWVLWRVHDQGLHRFTLEARGFLWLGDCFLMIVSVCSTAIMKLHLHKGVNKDWFLASFFFLWLNYIFFFCKFSSAQKAYISIFVMLQFVNYVFVSKRMWANLYLNQWITYSALHYHS